MEIDGETGTTVNFMAFEKVVVDDSTLYAQTKGVYHDISDPGDGQQYYYASFIYNTNKMVMLKAHRKTAEIVWSYIHETPLEEVKSQN